MSYSYTTPYATTYSQYSTQYNYKTGTMVYGTPVYQPSKPIETYHNYYDDYYERERKKKLAEQKVADDKKRIEEEKIRQQLEYEEKMRLYKIEQQRLFEEQRLWEMRCRTCQRTGKQKCSYCCDGRRQGTYMDDERTPCTNCTQYNKILTETYEINITEDDKITEMSKDTNLIRTRKEQLIKCNDCNDLECIQQAINNKSFKVYFDQYFLIHSICQSRSINLTHQGSYKNSTLKVDYPNYYQRFLGLIDAFKNSSDAWCIALPPDFDPTVRPLKIPFVNVDYALMPLDPYERYKNARGYANKREMVIEHCSCRKKITCVYKCNRCSNGIVTNKVEKQGLIKCTECNGSSYNKYSTCLDCNGTGYPK
ncbi:MAG: hypothetical protein Terrestrivirus1_45 [Terrestrivirus sp.]|uniref:Uncharacterized protein n=1 Tax=Terrestrivirus sp. TaxID=2487775 RepID=A0A3G4ZMA9_9VIRU|nr:MAG: hypothetical protein Terrestrivirus1_45 [Terrestrivirus sp.]